MRILLLPKYGPKAASTRYRFLQYLPALKSAGITCAVSPLFDDRYLVNRFSSGSALEIDVLRALVRRLSAFLIAGRFDLVVLHCEAFPYAPAWFERLLTLRGIPYVFDYDDAIFHQYDQHRNRMVRWLFRGKIATVIARAALVIAGNEYLASYARPKAKRVEVVPTAVDLTRYHSIPKRAREDKPFIVGWMGSQSTAEYLKMIAAPLQSFCADGQARVRVVGSGPLELPGVAFDLRAWSEAREVEDLLQFDVGIMPLPDTPWARGKSGFKLIQYMACGLPVVASAVGVNNEIVEDGVNGFLARTDEDWVRALTEIRDSPELRHRMGSAGRSKVERQYCTKVTAPRLVSLLKNLPRRTESRRRT